MPPSFEWMEGLFLFGTLVKDPWSWEYGSTEHEVSFYIIIFMSAVPRAEPLLVAEVQSIVPGGSNVSRRVVVVPLPFFTDSTVG